MLKARQLFFFFFFSFFQSIGKTGGSGGLILFLEREKERGEGGREEGDMRGMWGGREFYDIILGKREGGRGEGEDRLKSAMGIKSFCHDILFFENGVFGRWNLLDMNKNMDRVDWDIGGFALKNVVGMPKI